MMSEVFPGLALLAQAGAVAEGTEAWRRIGHAAVTWLSLLLVGMVAFSAFVIWHLVRRGRLIRDQLGPPRAVDLPELEPRGEPPVSSSSSPAQSAREREP
jgi:hypothetical protein